MGINADSQFDKSAPEVLVMVNSLPCHRGIVEAMLLAAALPEISSL